MRKSSSAEHPTEGESKLILERHIILEAAMFKVFTTSEKPGSSHNRFKTLEHIHSSNENINASPGSATIVHGYRFDLIEPISVNPTALTQHEQSIGAPLAEPTKSHQRTLTEQIRSARDLPPLVTEASKSELHPASSFAIPTLNSPTQLKQLSSLREQSGQSSLPMAQRSSIFTGDQNTQSKAGEKVGKLADWFKGESEPISIGILPSPTKEKADLLDTMAPSSDIRPATLLQRTPTAQTISKPTMASRFSFLANRVSPPKSTPQSSNANDELINMDISTVLLPTSSIDSISPAAFKTLQQKAESLLLRLQAAYKERTISLRDMAAEKETLAEETQGAKMTARHLKTQLEDLSTKLTEQDEAMMDLVDELAEEKLARREEEEARRRSLGIVEHIPPATSSHLRISLENTVSDLGLDSEDDSPAESVSSTRIDTYSPTMSMSSVSTMGSPEAYHAPDFQAASPSPGPARLCLPTRPTTKGRSALRQDGIVEEPSQSACANCNGVRASEAWSVVGILKEENANLKERVVELEGALDGCLDVVCRLSC